MCGLDGESAECGGGEFECLCETQREVAARNLEKVGCRAILVLALVCE